MRRDAVTDNTYKVTEIVGTSPESIHQAVRNGIKKAGETLRNLDWFEVVEVRGVIEGDEVDHFQAVMKLGFRVED
jgi:dodecin